VRRTSKRLEIYVADEDTPCWIKAMIKDQHFREAYLVFRATGAIGGRLDRVVTPSLCRSFQGDTDAGPRRKGD